MKSFNIGEGDCGYIEVEYCGFSQKGLKLYNIRIYQDECGCVFDIFKRFDNINQACDFAKEYYNKNY